MPKSKKKRGGTSTGSIVNKGNIHDAKHFSSNKKLLFGCAGCKNGNVQVGPMQGGGNARETTMNHLKQAANDGLGYGYAPSASTQKCGVQSSTSMGAGRRKVIQSGGSNNSVDCVSYFNNLRSPGYGLNVPDHDKLNVLLKGSGYPVVVPFNTNKCGGKRKTKRKRRKRKKRKSKKKYKRKRRRTRKLRGGTGLTKFQKLAQWGQYNIGFPPQMKGGKGKTKRKKMKGGYHQYGSNNPMTPGYASPAPAGKLPWATGPLSKARQINCQDNYNHFSGKSSPSPVLDKAMH